MSANRRLARLPVVPEDRRCRAATLGNPIRSWLAPPSRTLDLLDLGGARTVADFGAGVGFFAPETLRRLPADGRLYLVDPDAANLARARAAVAGDARVSVLVSSAARVGEIPDASVDRVLLSLVICCVVDKDGVMDEAWRVLRPGGRTYVSYPTRVPRLTRRRASLRVSPARWEALVARRPWTLLREHNGWVVTSHLLEKPLVP